MSGENLSGILPAVGYRVPAKHLRTSGATAIFILPAQFADYMKEAGVGPGSALRDEDLEELGKATRLEVIQGVTTIHVELAGGRTVPAVRFQAKFKINRRRGAPFYYVLQSIYPEAR